MRLSDAHPQFIRAEDGLKHMVDSARAQGIYFDCPCGGGHLLLVWFTRAMDGSEPAPPTETSTNRWPATGTGFEDLTLSPSIKTVCWHGFITKGQITNCP